MADEWVDTISIDSSTAARATWRTSALCADTLSLLLSLSLLLLCLLPASCNVFLLEVKLCPGVQTRQTATHRPKARRATTFANHGAGNVVIVLVVVVVFTQ